MKNIKPNLVAEMVTSIVAEVRRGAPVLVVFDRHSLPGVLDMIKAGLAVHAIPTEIMSSLNRDVAAWSRQAAKSGVQVVLCERAFLSPELHVNGWTRMSFGTVGQPCIEWRPTPAAVMATVMRLINRKQAFIESLCVDDGHHARSVEPDCAALFESLACRAPLALTGTFSNGLTTDNNSSSEPSL